MTSPPTLAETAATEVRAEMGRQRMSSAALAQALGVSDMYVSRRLRGETAFDLTDIERTAKILGVPVSQFLPAEQTASTS